MEEAHENGKESLNSAHANGINEFSNSVGCPPIHSVNITVKPLYFVPVCFAFP